MRKSKRGIPIIEQDESIRVIDGETRIVINAMFEANKIVSVWPGHRIELPEAAMNALEHKEFFEGACT